MDKRIAVRAVEPLGVPLVACPVDVLRSRSVALGAGASNAARAGIEASR